MTFLFLFLKINKFHYKYYYFVDHDFTVADFNFSLICSTDRKILQTQFIQKNIANIIKKIVLQKVFNKRKLNRLDECYEIELIKTMINFVMNTW